LLIAKTKTSQQIIGNWSVVDSNAQTVDCAQGPSTGVTHTINTDKTSVAAVWSPPLTSTGEDTVIK
jgi:hypothetical protein